MKAGAAWGLAKAAEFDGFSKVTRGPNPNSYEHCYSASGMMDEHSLLFVIEVIS